MAVAFLALLALACTGKQQAGAATGTPTVQVQVGDAAQINEVDYVALQRLGFDRLPKARVEPAGEARLGAQVRRVPAFRLMGQSRAALRYTEDGAAGWVVWQPAAVLYARRELAKQAGRPVSQIQTVDVTHQTWPDGCLGLTPTDRSCSQAQVEGFLVTLRLDGRTYEYRTDLHDRALPSS
ncbi:MAG: hypothetical protein U0531_21990 [Dehalococcoidia bacterium]